METLAPAKQMSTTKAIQNTGSYKLASMVVEIEVVPKTRQETYDRFVQCDIIEAHAPQSKEEGDDLEDTAWETKMARKPTVHAGVVHVTRDDTTQSRLCSKCQAESQQTEEPKFLAKE